MSMHRRPVPRTRLLAAVGAVVAIVGCLLPWASVGGYTGELPLVTFTGFESYGILVFVASIATLALVTLPYASERPVGADRWLSYALITVVGWLGLVAQVLSLYLVHAFTFREPVELATRMPGLWLAVVGLAILGRATYGMAREPRLR